MYKFSSKKKLCFVQLEEVQVIISTFADAIANAPNIMAEIANRIICCNNLSWFTKKELGRNIKAKTIKVI